MRWLLKRGLGKFYAKFRIENGTPVCVTQPHRFVKNIDGNDYGIPDVAGVGFSGLDYDFSIRQLNSVMLDVCGELNTIDLHSSQFESSHFYDGVHTTAEGSIYLGELLFEELKKRDFFGFE